MIEGFADYVGNLGSTLSVRQIAPELGAEVARSRVPSALPTTADFAGSNPRLAQAYEEAWLACRLIAARAGANGLVRFYTLVGRGRDGRPVDRGRRGTAGGPAVSTSPAFTAAWRAQRPPRVGGDMSRKLLIVTNDFPPRQGGIQSFVFELARRLPADQVAVYTSAYAGSDEFDAEPGLSRPTGIRPACWCRRRAHGAG